MVPGPSTSCHEAISGANPTVGRTPLSPAQCFANWVCAPACHCSPLPLLISAFPLSGSHVAVCSGNYGDVLWELLSWRDDDDEFSHGHAVKHMPDCTAAPLNLGTSIL